jgi:hypothetical protein
MGTATAWRFINLRIVGFSLEPPSRLSWLSPGDTVRLVTSALTAPSIHVVTCYGVSQTRGGSTPTTVGANSATTRKTTPSSLPIGGRMRTPQRHWA